MKDTKHINIKNLEMLVVAMENLPKNIRSAPLDLISTRKPEEGDPVSHEGIIALVAQELTEIKDYYNAYLCKSEYCFTFWQFALSNFLAEEHDLKDIHEYSVFLIDYLDDHPEVFGNDDGRYIYCDCNAFNVDRTMEYEYKPVVTCDEIIEKWKQVITALKQGRHIDRQPRYRSH